MMRKLVFFVMVVSGVGLMASPATATTRPQVVHAIDKVHRDIDLIHDYAVGKRARLYRTTCVNLREHARTLNHMTKPRAISLDAWGHAMIAAVEYQEAGQACLDLDQPNFGIHLKQGGDAVRKVRKVDLALGRRFGAAAITAGGGTDTDA